MEIKFNCTGTERKRLAQAIGMIVEARPEYQFMPTCAYKIGQHTLDKNGTLHFTKTRSYTDEVGELLNWKHRASRQNPSVRNKTS